jgi:hypothetical protein
LDNFSSQTILEYGNARKNGRDSNCKVWLWE